MRLDILHIRIAAMVSLIAAGCACHSAQKPATVVPPGKIPGIQAARRTPVPTQTAEPSVNQIPEPAANVPSSAASDSVGEVVARAEQHYQTGLANYHSGKQDEAKQNVDDALNELL